MGSTTTAATSPLRSSRSSACEVAGGHLVEPRHELAEALAELLAAVDRQGAQHEAVKGVLEVEHARTPGGRARELEGGVHGVGAGVGEEDGVESGRHPRDELLGEEAGEQRDVHLDEARPLQLEGFLERAPHRGVVAAEIEDTVAGEEVEVALAVGVPEVRALALHPDLVEADDAQDAGQLGAEVAGVAARTGRTAAA